MSSRRAFFLLHIQNPFKIKDIYVKLDPPATVDKLKMQEQSQKWHFSWPWQQLGVTAQHRIEYVLYRLIVLEANEPQ